VIVAADAESKGEDEDEDEDEMGWACDVAGGLLFVDKEVCWV
jgi:hypothetical protein